SATANGRARRLRLMLIGHAVAEIDGDGCAPEHDNRTRAALAERRTVVEGVDAPQPQHAVGIARELNAPRGRDIVQELHAGLPACPPATRNGDFLHAAAFEPQQDDYREEQEQGEFGHRSVDSKMYGAPWHRSKTGVRGTHPTSS